MALEFSDFETTVDGKTWYGTYEDCSSYRCYGYDGSIPIPPPLPTYWKQAERWRHQAEMIGSQLGAAERRLKELSTLRGAWRNLLRALRERGR